MVDRGNVTLLHDVNLDMEAFWEEIPRLADKNGKSSLEKFSELLQRSMFIKCVHTVKKCCVQFGRGEVTIELKTRVTVFCLFCMIHCIVCYIDYT